ncbi:MAG: 1,4-dihydroxy-2-naphthoate octaprenyltransferase [Bdellovibrio sp.]|nr:MAG: 1,4-dihydroxy-2-naphthoate octaprenyltransferase [Bdellovibrio sp.]
MKVTTLRARLRALRIWWQALRPKTLTAAVVPIIGATGLSIYEQASLQNISYENVSLRWAVPALALVASLFIQIATNLINDVEDFKKGADTKERIGPLRVTQAGLVSSQAVQRAAVAFFLGAVLAGLPLVWIGGWPILLIGIASLLAGYSYTAGPFPLAYQGLGDLFVVLFFGLVAVMGLNWLMTGVWSFASVILGSQIGLHCAVLIAINNLRDYEGDRRAGKKTVAVRFGKPFGRCEILFLLLVPFSLNLYWLERGAGWAAALGLITLPWAAGLGWKIFTLEPGPAYNQLLARAAVLHFAFGVLTTVGLVLCR